MAKEVMTAREDGVKGLRSRNATVGRGRSAYGGRSAKIPKGKKLNYDDDIVTVYDEKGKKLTYSHS